MKNLLILSLLLCGSFSLWGQEPYLKNQTYTYAEATEQYKSLDSTYADCKYYEFGNSDYGHPVSLFVINKGGMEVEGLENKGRILINNAIHPGEPCGVDACIKLAKELLAENKVPENVVIGIIPIYNVGGAHNRNCCSRANQNGPKEYGFRGNAKNLDLNRDFIKADSKNTLAFYKIFHRLKPHLFVDTHTSNGADYQHTMTLITSQLDKMNPALANYTKEKLNPFLFSKMEEENYPMVPYVHSVKSIPDHGIMDYLETPRYSTGYTNLFNCIGYVTEAHMLKPYEERVNATYLFLKHLIAFTNDNHKELDEKRKESIKAINAIEKLPLNWTLDTLRYDEITFKGYTAAYKPSKVTGLDRLYYDRDKPWTKKIKYFNRFTPSKYVEIPNYYIIPKAWDKVIELYQLNGIPVYQLKEDQLLTVEGYYIEDYKTGGRPYEGHYLHKSIEVDKVEKTINYAAGDYIIPVRNENIRFIVETLEPHAPDSYFAWNYFDATLQQKEWFSSYVFEDEAPEILANNPDLKAEFEEKQRTDSSFAANSFAQLYFIYKHSDHYERTSNFYPITRYNGNLDETLIKRSY